MRERLLGAGGAPVPEDERAQPAAAVRPEPPLKTPRGRPAAVPLSFGHVSEEQIARWREECLRRRGVTEGRNAARWGDGEAGRRRGG